MLEAVSIMLLLAIALMARGNPFQFAPALAGFPSDHQPPRPERKAWEDLLMFKKGGGSSAPAPDPQIGEAAVMQAKTGQDWLNFAREQFTVGNERQAVIDELTGKVTEAQLKGMTDANDRADQQWKRYQEVFQPAQDKYIEEAMNWDSPERQAAMAAEAKGDVMSNAAAAKQSSARNMASMGVSPTSGRYAGVERAGDLGTALAAAGAQNNARNQVRTQGLALKEGVANMAQGATSTSAQQSSLGLNSGNSATGNINAANSQWQGNNQIMGQGFQGAMQGYAGQASTLNNLYGNQLNAWSAQQQANSASSAGLMSGIGSLVGSGAALWALSSKEFKENKRPADGALEAVEKMPVEQWSYKEGIADGGEHIGPYAEDFQAATGKGDGKTIPIVDAIGVTMGAVQELSKNMKDISSKVEVISRKANPMAGGIA
jgi:hypothetical protein